MHASLVVKAGRRFDAQGAFQPLDTPPQINAADRHRASPDHSGLVAAGDAAPCKRQAELWVFGNAYPPSETRIFNVALGLRRVDGRKWSKTLRVHGARYWKGSANEPRVTKAAFATPTPLAWESAFGGADYRLNPAGQGYIAKTQPIADAPLPLLEYASDPVTHPFDRPTPASFGPIPIWWPQRNSHPETRTAAATEGDSTDAVTRVACDASHNAAPADQQFDEPFTGGERLAIDGMLDPAAFDGRRIGLTLPTFRPQALLRDAAGDHDLPLTCDTLIIDTDVQEIHWVWRAHWPSDPDDAKKEWVVLSEAGGDAPHGTPS